MPKLPFNLLTLLSSLFLFAIALGFVFDDPEMDRKIKMVKQKRERQELLLQKAKEFSKPITQAEIEEQIAKGMVQ